MKLPSEKQLPLCQETLSRLQVDLVPKSSANQCTAVKRTIQQPLINYRLYKLTNLLVVGDLN